MIKLIIDLLQVNQYYGVSKRVDIAKGKNEIPYTWKQGLEKIKRIWHGRRNKN